ncbi:MAG: hypothetical protein JXR73_21345 [Candidatus Omnitrophica bacterium]|nr:hypothetical protein [Candidatus Omnitrophota bacterium]
MKTRYRINSEDEYEERSELNEGGNDDLHEQSKNLLDACDAIIQEVLHEDSEFYLSQITQRGGQ